MLQKIYTLHAIFNYSTRIQKRNFCCRDCRKRREKKLMGTAGKPDKIIFLPARGSFKNLAFSLFSGRQIFLSRRQRGFDFAPDGISAFARFRRIRDDFALRQNFLYFVQTLSEFVG